MTFLSALTFFAAALRAQTSATPDFSRLLGELEDSIHGADLIKAADLASTLDDGVQRQFRASLNVDSAQRVTDVLAWLPAETETMFVLREPIVLKANDAPAVFEGKPAQLYALDRLMGLNGGQFYRRLQGRTVRPTVVGMGNIGNRAPGGVPSLMPEAEVTYFYFFSEPLTGEALGTPEEVIAMHPLWRETAKIDAGEPWRPGVHERALREDENWLTLVRPDLLVLSSRRQAILNLLGRVGQQNPNSNVRAFPDSLPEWMEVDRRASFWGLRHYSESGERRDSSNPRTGTPNQPKSDGSAIDVTVKFDTESGVLEVHYLSGADQLPPFIKIRPEEHEFQTVATRSGVWQLKSNTHDRGDFPFHYAAHLLGFGEYR
jgi:hypothetical protein